MAVHIVRFGNKGSRLTGVHRPRPRAVQPGLESDNFEEVLADLSATFIRTAAEDIDDQIEHWLQRTVMSLGLDRGTLTQFDESGEAMWVSHQWARKGIPTPYKGGINLKQYLPWLACKIASDDMVVLSNPPHGLPRDAVQERQALKAQRVKSHITLPLKIGGRVAGGLSLATLSRARQWSKKDIRRLRLVAEIFGNALERKRAFAEYQRLEHDLRKIEGMALVGELAAILTHELRQPLTAILSNAETACDLLKGRAPDLVEIGEALEDIIRDDARADEIIRNVRAMFQRGEASKASVDIKEVLLDIDRIASMSARAKGVRLSMRVPEFLPSVLGDRTQLAQATLNLIFNAFDSVCAADPPRDVTLTAAAVQNNRVRISVQDSGTGIDPKIRSRLFEPFFTTKATGMGIGLAIVHSIVENHGGKIWVSPSVNRGALFEFELPVEKHQLGVPGQRTNSTD